MTGFAHQFAGLRIQHLVIMAENGTKPSAAGRQQSGQKEGYSYAWTEKLHPQCQIVRKPKSCYWGF